MNKEKIKTVGIVGPNADSRKALVGNYHGTASRYCTIQEGIQDYLGDDVRVLASVGCDLFRDRTEHLAFTQDRLAEAKIVAENSDIVILCVGLDEHWRVKKEIPETAMLPVTKRPCSFHRFSWI